MNDKGFPADMAFAFALMGITVPVDPTIPSVIADMLIEDEDEVDAEHF